MLLWFQIRTSLWLSIRKDWLIWACTTQISCTFKISFTGLITPPLWWITIWILNSAMFSLRFLRQSPSQKRWGTHITERGSRWPMIFRKSKRKRKSRSLWIRKKQPRGSLKIGEDHRESTPPWILIRYGTKKKPKRLRKRKRASRSFLRKICNKRIKYFRVNNIVNLTNLRFSSWRESVFGRTELSSKATRPKRDRAWWPLKIWTRVWGC